MQIKSAVLALTAMAGVVLAQTNAFSVATPLTLSQCVPYQINITGGTPPFIVQVTQPGDTSSIIETLATTSSRQITWTVNLNAGQKITLHVVDSTGAFADSGQSNATNSGNSSCVNQSASVSTGATTPASSASGSSAATGGSTGAASTTAPSSTGGASSGGSSSRSSSSSAPSSTGSKNGAGQLSGYSAAVAGAVGVVVAALF